MKKEIVNLGIQFGDEKRTVGQAFEAHNREIDAESRLGKAVESFMSRYGLVYECEEDGEDD